MTFSSQYLPSVTTRTQTEPPTRHGILIGYGRASDVLRPVTSPRRYVASAATTTIADHHARPMISATASLPASSSEIEGIVAPNGCQRNSANTRAGTNAI